MNWVEFVENVIDIVLFIAIVLVVSAVISKTLTGVPV